MNLRNLSFRMERKGATLILENGIRFEGWSFGYDGPCDGEVVFSTAMVGYPESLTDPSYSGQILCVTYPLIGNYGVPDDGVDEWGISKNFESEKIHVRGLVISDCSFEYSHWNAVKSLDQWLREQKIPGIYGIDTRELTKILRENGSMLGMIVPEGVSKSFPVPDPNMENQVAVVSCKEVIRYGKGEKKVVMVDCGVKHNILRCFVNRGIEIVRVPWNYDFNTLEYDGLFISNGPGNPEFCDVTVANIRYGDRETDFRNLYGQPAALPRGGSEDLQAQIRSPQPQPAGQDGWHQQMLHHITESRICS